MATLGEMHLRTRFGRKQFLTLTLTSASAAALGCSGEDVGPAPGASGAGGSAGASAGTAGTAGTFSSASGAGGTAPTAGASGSASGGAGAGAGGATAGGGAGGSGGAMMVPGDCSMKLRVKITADHGHVMNVTMDDVMAGVDKIYDTAGTSGHPHWVKLTAADFSKLRAGGTARKISCNDGHEHEFIVNCLGNEMPTTTGVTPYCDAEHKCGETNTSFCPEPPEML